MKRGGRRHAPYYRVVVMDSRTRMRGREVDQIGRHHPCARPQPVTEVDAPKALEWLLKGARPSITVRNILSKKGVMAALAQGKTPADLAHTEAAADAEAPEAAEAVAETAHTTETVAEAPVEPVEQAEQAASTESETTEGAPEREPAG